MCVRSTYDKYVTRESVLASVRIFILRSLYAWSCESTPNLSQGPILNTATQVVVLSLSTIQMLLNK
jgi:hypothetical protein